MFGNILLVNLVKVMFYITLYAVNLLWIISSTSQSLLFDPFDAGFCASFPLSFQFWGTYWHIFASDVPRTWIS